jgi:CRISPR-associated protein Cas1
MIHLPIVDGNEFALRTESLHALLYCERLFYLQEVERIDCPNDRVYAGRELHESLAVSDEGESFETVEVASTSLGLFGKIDAIKRRDGLMLPYEHKRGRCKRAEDNTPLAWPSDRVQVLAYAMMLEESLGRAVPEGRMHYHADNVTVRVPVDDAARAEVRAAIERARELRRAIDRPPIAENESLCRRCSLAPVCLPEEVRQDRDPRHEVVRLFPPDDQRASLHVVSPGTMVGRAADRFLVRAREGPERKYPSHEVSAILLHGFSQISTQALRLCVDRDVAVHWLGTGGQHLASLTSSVGQVQRRIRQYRALTDEAIRLRLAKQLVRAKIEGQHRYLLRATRGVENSHDRNLILPVLRDISSALAAAAHAPDQSVLRGHEGDAAASYFSALPTLLSNDVPESLRYAGRSRRPTMDRFSAILNFGYALLQTAVMRALLAVGLEPALGFYHTPRSAAHPLVLDLMELFRSPLWDMQVIASLNRGQWDADADFIVTKTKIWLSDSGKAKAIDLFESRLQENWKHPVVNYSLSYARTIELEARLLEKEWSGEEGLFARMRLR